MRLLPLLSKELRELARSYKLLFVPVAFGILGLGQPVAIKLMPQLLQSASNLPAGTVIEIPMPPPGQVAAAVIGQLNQLGILLLVLVCMGAVAAERVSGVAATVLSKPVGRGAYLSAKAIAFAALAAFSLAVGLGFGAYYTEVLLGPLNWGDLALGFLLYLPNLLLVVAATLLCSACLPSPLAAGGAGLVSVVLLNTVPRYMGRVIAKLNPGYLTGNATAVIGGAAEPAWGAFAAVLTFSLGLLIAGWLILRRQEI